jgi:hypothetical protein
MNIMYLFGFFKSPVSSFVNSKDFPGNSLRNYFYYC